MNEGNVLVVGGYGTVGRVITMALADAMPGRVIAAGRSGKRAEGLAASTDYRVRPLVFDLFNHGDLAPVLADVSLVVMCLDQPDTRFLEACIARGIDYVDVTADHAFLAAAEQLDDGVAAGGSTVVLSVGLAPGLTNLLARQACSALDEIEHIDLFVLLGLGEKHGEAAVRWMVRNVQAPFTLLEDGHRVTVHSFGDSTTTIFPNGFGRRRAYRFPFPAQHVLPHTLGVDSVATWLTFDSAPVTTLLGLARKSRLLSLLRLPAVEDVAVNLLRAVQIGSDQYVVKIEAQGNVSGKPMVYTAAVSGKNEARSTGLVAAEVARRLHGEPLPAGVFHIEQLFEPVSFLTRLGLGSVTMQRTPWGELAQRAKFETNEVVV